MRRTVFNGPPRVGRFVKEPAGPFTDPSPGGMNGIRKKRRALPAHRTSKRGSPKVMVVPEDLFDEPRPEEYPTLLKYVEAMGNLIHTTRAQLFQARHLYISKARNVNDVAAEVKLPVAIITRWVVAHGWQEERDRRHFEIFRRLTGKLDHLAPHTDERHDRIAGSIEAVIERMLDRHHNGDMELDAKDLQTIAATLKTTADLRRGIRGQKTKTSEQTVNLNVNMPDNLERVGAAVVSLSEERPALPPPKRHKVEVMFGESISTDDEFEDQEEI